MKTSTGPTVATGPIVATVYDAAYPDDGCSHPVNPREAFEYGEYILSLVRGNQHDPATLRYLLHLLTQFERIIGITHGHFIAQHLMSPLECWCNKIVRDWCISYEDEIVLVQTEIGGLEKELEFEQHPEDRESLRHELAILIVRLRKLQRESK